MIWLLGLLAFGEDNLPELWAQMHEGQLVHLVDGSPQEAIEIFEALLKGLPQEHPLFGELLFSLGRAQYDAGNLEEAKKSIYSSLYVDHVPKQANTYYLHLMSQESGMRTLSYSGNPWVFLEGKEQPNQYVVRLYDAAKSFSIAYLDIYTPNSIQITIYAYTQKGKKQERDYRLSMGSHRILLDAKEFMKSDKKTEIIMLEVQTKNQDSFSLSSLVLQ